jgi:chromate transporter
MSEAKTLAALAAGFGLLSLQAVGGGTAVLPEMQRLVESHSHVTAQQFAQAYSLGQLAPGPNMLMVIVLGDHIAGVAGAIVVLLAFFIPASVLCFFAGRIWNHFGDTPWRRAVQSGLAPISIGLMVSGVYTLAKSEMTGWIAVALALLVLAFVVRTKINPTLLILSCAVLGAILLPHHR